MWPIVVVATTDKLRSYYKRSYKNLPGTNMYIITKCIYNIMYLQSQHKYKQPRERYIGVIVFCLRINLNMNAKNVVT